MTWTNKYKKSIDCSNPKGFSQKAHCQARKLRRKGMKTKSKPIQEANEAKHYEAIKDVHVNLENRNHAIDEYGYGPLNPKEKNDDFWNEKAKLWKTSVEEAKKSRCYNCAAFNQTPKILKAMGDALGPVGDKIVEKANLGYCEFFYFKCAGERTCDAWITNGPLQEAISSDDTSVSSVSSAMKRGTGVPRSSENESPEGFQPNKLPSSSEVKKYRDIKLDKMRSEPVRPELAKDNDFDTPERKDFLRTYYGKEKLPPITAPMLPGRLPADEIPARVYNSIQDTKDKEYLDYLSDKSEPTVRQSNLSPAQRGIRTIRRALNSTLPVPYSPLRETKLIPEDAPANAAGSGEIAGLGVGPQGEPGVSVSKQRKNQKENKKGEQKRELELNLFRRNAVVAEESEKMKTLEGEPVKAFVVEKGKFAGHETFIVPTDVFHNAKTEKKKGKHWTKYIGNDDYGKAIRQHARMNFSKPIILQDERTGAMCYARYGKK